MPDPDQSALSGGFEASDHSVDSTTTWQCLAPNQVCLAPQAPSVGPERVWHTSQRSETDGFNHIPEPPRHGHLPFMMLLMRENNEKYLNFSKMHNADKHNGPLRQTHVGEK